MWTTFEVENYIMRTLADIRKDYTKAEWKELVAAFGEEWKLEQQLKRESAMNIKTDAAKTYWRKNHKKYGCGCCGDNQSFIRFKYNGKVCDTFDYYSGIEGAVWPMIVRDLEIFLKNGQTKKAGNEYTTGAFMLHKNPELLEFSCMDRWEYGEPKKMVAHKKLMLEALFAGAESAYRFFIPTDRPDAYIIGVNRYLEKEYQKLQEVKELYLREFK